MNGKELTTDSSFSREKWGDIHVVDHFYQFHFNQIHAWHERNREHFHLHHFNQFWFHVILKLFCIFELTFINHIGIKFTLDMNWTRSSFVSIAWLHQFEYDTVASIWCCWYCLWADSPNSQRPLPTTFDWHGSDLQTCSWQFLASNSLKSPISWRKRWDHNVVFQLAKTARGWFIDWTALHVGEESMNKLDILKFLFPQSLLFSASQLFRLFTWCKSGRMIIRNFDEHSSSPQGVNCMSVSCTSKLSDSVFSRTCALRQFREIGQNITQIARRTQLPQQMSRKMWWFSMPPGNVIKPNISSWATLRCC
jgi:hypothetical protein